VIPVFVLDTRRLASSDQKSDIMQGWKHPSFFMKINYSLNLPGDDGLWNLFIPLENVEPPPSTRGMKQCPALEASRNQSYILKSPFNFKMAVGVHGGQVRTFNDEGDYIYRDYISMNNTANCVNFQILFFLMFWTPTETKKDFQLFIHGVPGHLRTGKENWFLIDSLLNKRVIDRNMQSSIQLREGENVFTIERGEPLMCLTFFANEKVDLRFQPSVPTEVVNRSVSRSKATRLCPYTFARSLYEKLL